MFVNPPPPLPVQVMLVVMKTVMVVKVVKREMMVKVVKVGRRVELVELVEGAVESTSPLYCTLYRSTDMFSVHTCI